MAGFNECIGLFSLTEDAMRMAYQNRPMRTAGTQVRRPSVPCSASGTQEAWSSTLAGDCFDGNRVASISDAIFLRQSVEAELL